MLVLVADAEPEYGELIGELLRRQSYRVVLAPSSDSCRRFLDRSATDIIILSSSITREPLRGLIGELSRRQAAPIIALVEDTGPAELTACLTAGADDCVRKPFHPGEFAARVDAVARRCRGTGAPPMNRTSGRFAPSHDYECSTERGLVFDHTLERVYGNGRDLQFTQLEYQILSAIAAMEGGVLPYSVLNERIWGYSNLTDGTLLKGHVSSIRRKLSSEGLDPNLIRTVYGIGYALSSQPGEASPRVPDLLTQR